MEIVGPVDLFKPSLEINSLEDERLRLLLNTCKVVVSDIDYTLVDISNGHAAGVGAVARVTNQELALRFNKIFHLIVEGHRKSEKEAWEERASFVEVTSRMQEIQRKILPEFGLKYWSKETMLLIAAEDVGFVFTEERLRRARDWYWQTRTQESRQYADVGDWVETLANQGVILELFTSSYHIMQIGEGLSLNYEPKESRNYKLNAIRPHLPQYVKSVIVGDPVDKPEPEFFDNVIRQMKIDLGLNQDEDLDWNKVGVVGDSVRNDLEYFGRMGANTVLVKR